jgi:hypothetical protein
VCSQVDVHEYEIESEARQMNVVLAGDGKVMLKVSVGRSDGIVHGDDDRESPCQECQDLVGYDSGRVMRFPLSEGVYWEQKGQSSIVVRIARD